MHSFDGCKAARFNNSKTMFAALSTETSPREVLLYDIQTCNLLTKFSDSASSSGPGRVHVQSLIHFHPDDERLLWNGVLWDKRTPSVVRQFDQFTDHGGGGFHPAGNEVTQLCIIQKSFLQECPAYTEYFSLSMALSIDFPLLVDMITHHYDLD